MTIVIPRQSTPASTSDPRLFLLLAATKTGKTESCLKLPNSLLIDLEDGSEFYDGNKLNLKRMSIQDGKGLGSLLLETAATIREANQQNGKPVFDFITIDTLTVVEDLAKLKATIDYKNTVQGKNFSGKDVTRELAKGAGFAFMTAAFNDLINPFKGLPAKCLILVAHKKLSNPEKESGIEISINDIELTGKNKLVATSNADSIAHLYRSKRNPYQNIMSFKKDEGDTIWGSRSRHLQNRSFVFSEFDPKTNTLKTNWDLIFTSLRGENSPVMQEVNEDEDEKQINSVNGSTNNKQNFPV